MTRPGRLFSLLLAVVAAYLLGTVAGRGIYWDEEAQSRHGRDVIEWYASGLQDRSAFEQWNLIFYGGTVETALELAASAAPDHRVLVRHVGVALSGLLLLLGVFRLGSVLGAPWVGLVAAALLALEPRVLGHMFFNSKDIPFAALYVWVLALLAREVQRPDGAPLRATVPLGLTLGALLGTRIGGAIVVAPILAGYGLAWLTSGRGRPRAVRLLARFSTVCVIAYPTMLLAWPWAQARPLVHPLVALLSNGRFPFEYPQLFRGEWVGTLHLPRSYVPTWLGITTPEIVLFGLAVLIGVLAWGPRLLGRLREPATAAVAVAGALPLFYVVATRAALYDGPRHLLFTRPFIALAAASGLVLAFRALSSTRVPRWVRAAFVALTGALALLPLRATLTLRPYEYVYFNDVSGGLPAAEDRYELEYWGLAYREGMEWLSRNLQATDPERVASCSHPESSRPFVEGSVDYVGSTLFKISAPADILVYGAPQDCLPKPPWTPPPGRVLYRVERYGVPLLTVLKPEVPFVQDWECDGCRPPVPTAPESPPTLRDSRSDGRSSDPST